MCSNPTTKHKGVAQRSENALASRWLHLRQFHTHTFFFTQPCKHPSKLQDNRALFRGPIPQTTKWESSFLGAKAKQAFIPCPQSCSNNGVTELPSNTAGWTIAQPPKRRLGGKTNCLKSHFRCSNYRQKSFFALETSKTRTAWGGGREPP